VSIQDSTGDGTGEGIDGMDGAVDLAATEISAD